MVSRRGDLGIWGEGRDVGDGMSDPWQVAMYSLSSRGIDAHSALMFNMDATTKYIH